MIIESDTENAPQNAQITELEAQNAPVSSESSALQTDSRSSRSVQCTDITLQGRRCTRVFTIYSESEAALCYQHKNKAPKSAQSNAQQC